MLYSMSCNNKLMVVGARSNYVSGPQLVKEIPYTNVSGLQAFADERALRQSVTFQYWGRIVFFFVLIKTEALLRIGFLDEIFGLGNFEDDDYCLRVAAKGYKCGFNNNVYIHHYGSRSFVNNKLDYAAIMETNRKKFLKKWKLTEGKPGDGHAITSTVRPC